MVERTQVEKAQTKRTEDVVVETKAPTQAEKTEKLKADVDSLLDEIDEILNNESVETVNSYVQKGGE